MTMACRPLPFAASLALMLALSGCSNYEQPRRPAWRGEAERACLARSLIRASPYIQPAKEIDGPGICGLSYPFKVTALLDGAVRFNSTYTLDCPMIATLNAWLAGTVQPSARARFGQEVAEIVSMGAYSCRTMNNMPGARLSEHAFGNALDIGGFRLADGREISIVRDWTRGDSQTRAFLQDVHAGACRDFTTVLSPGANIFHYNHIHVDLALHGNTSNGPRRICRPALGPSPVPEPPRDNLPNPPEIEEDIETAQAGRLVPERPELQIGAGAPPAVRIPESYFAAAAKMPLRADSPLPPGRIQAPIRGAASDFPGLRISEDVTSSIPRPETR